MPKPRSLRRRPSTPNLKLQHDQRLNQLNQRPRHTADPTSPPETPTTSPPLSRKISQKPRHQLPFDYVQSHTQDPAIQPVGDGHQFSYRPVFGEQLSPRSSTSSSSSDGEVEDLADDEMSDRGSVGTLPDASDLESSEEEEEEEEEEEDDDEEDSDDEQWEDEESEPEQPQPRTTIHITTTTTTTTTVDYDFIIEDIDPMDSGCEGLDVLFPTEIESNRSRSRSRHKDLDKGMMQDLQNLNCSNEASDNEAAPPFYDEPVAAFFAERRSGIQPEMELDEEAFLRRRAELKRIRRVSMSSSFGKRTHSELSDSDGDDASTLDVNDVGSSARRMRKRLHRGSLLFQDPPAPRIDELEEPDSSEDDVFAAEQFLARELPYWTMEIIEADSSS